MSRIKIFVKIFLAIPHLIIIYLLLLPLGILTFLAWFSILFTGRYPKAFFEFTSGVLRWQANVVAYCVLLRDEYPPFSWEPDTYPVLLDIPRPERQSRFRLFVRAFAIVPNYLVFYFVEFAWFFTTFISWFAILITGRYPRGLFKFSVGVGRWFQRMIAYLYLLCDEYPPYSINADARPGNEWLSGIIGLPIFAGYVALYVSQASSVFSGPAYRRTTLGGNTIERQHPSIRKGSLRLTLTNHHAFDSTSTSSATFDIHAEKDGLFPTYFAPAQFRLLACDGRLYHVSEVRGSDFRIFITGGSEDVTVYFVTPRGRPICELYYTGVGGTLTFYFS